ncbi:MAG: hypothetical protein WBP13_04610 [Methylophilaceae bacterium]
MKLLLIALALVLPLSASAFDFKGISIGGASTPKQVLEKLGVKCGLGANEMQVCNGNVTIARETAYMNLVIDRKGIVQRISLSLSSSAFETVAPLLIEKFGTPTSTNRGEVQNWMGAKFEQVSHLWKGENEVEVRYSKYAGVVDKSGLSFTTKKDRELQGKSRENPRGDI